VAREQEAEACRFLMGKSMTKKEKLRRMLLYQKYIAFCLEGELGIMEKPEERMLKWFAFGHLPQHLQDVSKPFSELASTVVAECESGPERTVALRKLLEAKDAAVRAKLNPGG
jgi:hypothetical protein